MRRGAEGKRGEKARKLERVTPCESAAHHVSHPFPRLQPHHGDGVPFGSPLIPSLIYLQPWILHRILHSILDRSVSLPAHTLALTTRVYHAMMTLGFNRGFLKEKIRLSTQTQGYHSIPDGTQFAIESQGCA